MQVMVALSALLGVAQALLVPAPPGPYNVAVKHAELVDTNRIDTFAPQPNTKRRYMASVYLPVDAKLGCKTQKVPYMPPLTAEVFNSIGEDLGAPPNLLENFEMEFCDLDTVKVGMNHELTMKKFPVAIFSPGYQGSRLLYGALARSAASLGYIVITLDHTHETGVVEFPDGHAAYPHPAAANSNMTITLRQLEAS